jgi:hypothetical protein
MEEKGKKDSQLRFESARDVKRFLARTLNRFDSDKITSEKAKTIGYLCGKIVEVIRESDIEQRLTELEKKFLDGAR